MTTNSNLQKDKEFLADSLRQAESKRSLTPFLDDLLTEQEISDLAQRIRIAKGIIKDKTYQEVSVKVDASTSTITKVGQVIKYGRGAFRKLFGTGKR